MCSDSKRLSNSKMIFRQITHDDLGCASYLIGDTHVPTWEALGHPLDVPQHVAAGDARG